MLVTLKLCLQSYHTDIFICNHMHKLAAFGTCEYLSRDLFLFLKFLISLNFIDMIKSAGTFVVLIISSYVGWNFSVILWLYCFHIFFGTCEHLPGISQLRICRPSPPQKWSDFYERCGMCGIFIHNSKNRNHKTFLSRFSFYIVHSTSSIKIWPLLRGRGGGLHILN